MRATFLMALILLLFLSLLGGSAALVIWFRATDLTSPTASHTQPINTQSKNTLPTASPGQPDSAVKAVAWDGPSYMYDYQVVGRARR
jgi:hypothetical protein